MSQSIPDWLTQVHLQNFSDLLNCIDNPSSSENELTLKMYEEVIPSSFFSDYLYIIFHEWWVNPEKQQLGKGDIVLTNGKDILVTEVKRIKGFSKQIQEKNLLKVKTQARYYGLQIKKFRDNMTFANNNFNEYFKKAKIYSTYFTNISNQIIIIDEHISVIQQDNRLLNSNQTITKQINNPSANVALVKQMESNDSKLSDIIVNLLNELEKANIQLDDFIKVISKL